MNGTPSGHHRVFRQGEARRYLVLADPDTDHHDSFMVDLERKYVLQIGGVHTTSIHPHPNGQFVVIVYSHSPVIFGIGVVGDAGNPSFDPIGAAWY